MAPFASRGTHEELLARNGTYARLYDIQFRDAEPAHARGGARCNLCLCQSTIRAARYRFAPARARRALRSMTGYAQAQAIESGWSCASPFAASTTVFSICTCACRKALSRSSRASARSFASAFIAAIST